MRHEVHFLLEGGPVRVLGGTSLEGSGAFSHRIYRLLHRVARPKSKEKEVTDSEDDEYIWEWWLVLHRAERHCDAHGEVNRGSKINLKEDQSEFLEVRRLKFLVKKLSEFICFSSELFVEKLKEKEVTDSGKNEDDKRAGR